MVGHICGLDRLPPFALGVVFTGSESDTAVRWPLSRLPTPIPTPSSLPVIGRIAISVHMQVPLNRDTKSLTAGLLSAQNGSWREPRQTSPLPIPAAS